MALAAQALEAKKASNPCEQGEALEGMAARIERLMGLTAKVSGPQNAGPLDRTVRPEGQRKRSWVSNFSYIQKHQFLSNNLYENPKLFEFPRSENFSEI